MEGTGGGPENVQSVDTLIRHEDSNGPVRLHNLHVSQHIGTVGNPAIIVNSIGDIFAGDDLRGSVLTWNGNLGGLIVGGDLRGDITIHGEVESIQITGPIGTSGDQVAVSVEDQVALFSGANGSAAYLDLNIREEPSGPYGILGRLELGGDQIGALRYEESNDITEGDPGVYIAGDFDGTLTVFGDLDEPIAVGDDLLGNLTLQDGASASISIGGSLGDGTPDKASLIIGQSYSSTPITSDIFVGDGLLTGYILMRAPYAGTFTVNGNLDLELGSPNGVEFYAGLTGTFRLIDYTDEVDFAHMEGTITVGNTNGGHVGAFSSTGKIEIQENMRDGSNILFLEECQGLVNIGQGTVTGSTIHAKASTNPFQGQIILNSLVGGSAWNGAVKWGTAGGGVGTTISHSGAIYAATSSAWGGGAVGLATFHLHAQDCNPPDGDPTGANPEFVQLRFYGPVTWADGEMPFLIEYWDGDEWIPDNANWYLPVGRGTRVITLLYSDNIDPCIIPGDREYRITPFLTGDEALLSHELFNSTPLPVADFEYNFSTP